MNALYATYALVMQAWPSFLVLAGIMVAIWLEGRRSA